MEPYIPQSIDEYIEIFFKRKRLFLIPFMTVLLLTAGIYPFLPRVYEASVLILAQDDAIINPLLKDAEFHSSIPKQLKTLSAQILSWRNLIELAKNLGLTQNISNQADFERLIVNLRERIDIQQKSENIVKISYEDEDPVVVQKMADAVAESLITQNKRFKQETEKNAISFVDEQLHIYSDKLSSSERTFLVNKATQELEEVNKHRDLFRRQLDQTQQFNANKNEVQNPVINQLQTEIAETATRLYAISSDAKEGYPLVQELQDKMDLLKGRLEGEKKKAGSSPAASPSAVTPQYQSVNLELRALDLTAMTLQKRLEDLRQNRVEFKGASEEELVAMERDKKVNEDIYRALLLRLENAQIAQRLADLGDGGNFKIIDPARVPVKHSKPNPFKVGGLGFLLALAAGGGAVFLREFLDTSFRGINDAKDFLKVQALAYIPRIIGQEKDDALIAFQKRETFREPFLLRFLNWLAAAQAHVEDGLVYKADDVKDTTVSPYIVPFHDPESLPAEQYRILRTHMLFAHQQQPKLQTLLFTSAQDNEGKSTTCISTAVSMAQDLDCRVLLIDCDLRRGTVAQALGIAAGGGLSDYLSNTAGIETILKKSHVERLTTITAGHMVPNPAKLFGAEKLDFLMSQLRSRFDFILLDAPPVLGLADVPVLSRITDGVVFVVQSEKTRREIAKTAITELQDIHKFNVLGFVLTQVRQYAPDAVYQYVYSAYTHSYAKSRRKAS